MGVGTLGETGAETASFSYRLRRRIGGELDFALMLVRGVTASAPNARCLRIFAQRRSGHHAIINWIRYQLGRRHYFLNDCRASENPFTGAQLNGSLVHGIFGQHRVMRLACEARGWFTYKGVLLYNYEEYDIRRADREMPAHIETGWIGRSVSRHDVLIVRDPFNLLASKLRWAYGRKQTPSKPAVSGLSDAMELWKVYAREYLGESAHLRNRICISYNDWFASRDYRDETARRLGMVNQDVGVEEVAKWGPTVWGDSFDGLRYEGRAQKMKVLERWREFEADPVYRRLVADDELHDLSRKIFGELPGTEMMRSQAGGGRPVSGSNLGNGTY
jgi:hypothetical protein